MLVFKGKLKEHPRWEVENELYRFRNRVFSDRLGWDVESRRGLERDNFDKPDTHWVLIEDKQGLCGCIRLLSCAQDYMLPSIFPTALAGEAPPRGNDVWELTRLAIDADRAPRLENGISELTCVIFREVLAFARSRGSASWWPWSACRWSASSVASACPSSASAIARRWIWGPCAGRHPLPPGRAFRPRRPSPPAGPLPAGGDALLAVI
jgi:N-acyl-L-homoserine lactone synthetase